MNNTVYLSSSLLLALGLLAGAPTAQNAEADTNELGVIVESPNQTALSGAQCLIRESNQYSGCRLLASGVLYGVDGDGPVVAWQQMRASSPLGTTQLLGAWEVRDGAIRLIGHMAADGWSEAPALAPGNGDNEWLLLLPGRGGGTGHFNMDAIFELSADGDWRAIDMEQWVSDLQRALPPGMVVAKGIEMHAFSGGIWARSALWRSEDTNCCPTGGAAEFQFAVENGRLVLDGAQFHLTVSPARNISWDRRQPSPP